LSPAEWKNSSTGRGTHFDLNGQQQRQLVGLLVATSAPISLAQRARKSFSVVQGNNSSSGAALLFSQKARGMEAELQL
jgi:hypothetical protein